MQVFQNYLFLVTFYNEIINSVPISLAVANFAMNKISSACFGFAGCKMFFFFSDWEILRLWRADISDECVPRPHDWRQAECLETSYNTGTVCGIKNTPEYTVSFCHNNTCLWDDPYKRTLAANQKE